MNYNTKKKSDFIPSTRINKNFILEKHISLINKEKKNLEIVVTRFDENLNYLKNYQKFLTVYNKGNLDLNLNCKIVKRPNIGNDPESLFYHIVNNWDNLSDITFFCQGDINDRNDQLITYSDFENYINTNDIYFFDFLVFLLLDFLFFVLPPNSLGYSGGIGFGLSTPTTDLNTPSPTNFIFSLG